MWFWPSTPYSSIGPYGFQKAVPQSIKELQSSKFLGPLLRQSTGCLIHNSCPGASQHQSFDSQSTHCLLKRSGECRPYPVQSLSGLPLLLLRNFHWLIGYEAFSTMAHVQAGLLLWTWHQVTMYSDTLSLSLYAGQVPWGSRPLEIWLPPRLPQVPQGALGAAFLGNLLPYGSHKEKLAGCCPSLSSLPKAGRGPGATLPQSVDGVASTSLRGPFILLFQYFLCACTKVCMCIYIYTRICTQICIYNLHTYVYLCIHRCSEHVHRVM